MFPNFNGWQCEISFWSSRLKSRSTSSSEIWRFSSVSVDLSFKITFWGLFYSSFENRFFSISCSKIKFSDFISSKLTIMVFINSSNYSAMRLLIVTSRFSNFYFKLAAKSKSLFFYEESWVRIPFEIWSSIPTIILFS